MSAAVQVPATVPAELPDPRAIAIIPAVTTAVLAAGALIATSWAGLVSTLVALGFIQAFLVLSWVLGSALPGRTGALVLGAMTAAGADAAVLTWYEHGYQPVVGVLGAAVPLMFVHQLCRGVVRTRVVESLSGIAVQLLAVSAAAGLLLLHREGGGARAVTAIAAATGAALASQLILDAVLARPRFDPSIERGLIGALFGVLAAAAVGTVVLRPVDGFGTTRALEMGAGVGAVACLLAVGTSFTFAGLGSVGRVGSVGRPPYPSVAAVLLVFCFTVPAGYSLFSALSS